MAPIVRSLLSAGLLVVDAAAVVKGHEKGHEAGAGKIHGGRQTPEDLGFTSDGDMESGSMEESRMAAGFCLDLGAKGFPLPVFQMMQAADWNAQRYFEDLQSKGYSEDSLQMTGPQDAILKPDCMTTGRGKLKHMFVGDSQMMSLRNAFHRLNRCPEIWWDSNKTKQAQLSPQRLHKVGRMSSITQQAPDELRLGCREDGVASFIHWDAWAHMTLPVDDIKKEIKTLGLDPKDGDTVVVWVGSNFIAAQRRMGVLQDAIDQMHSLGVKLVWDSPTFMDTAIMAATSPHDEGRDKHTSVPITYTAIKQRKATGELGSDMYNTEKSLYNSGIEIPMTRRWQLTNRYRGLQCDGLHTDMRARDPVFYDTPCHGGQQRYGQNSNGCNWVEPFKTEVKDFCPEASGLDDLVLQSGLYSICAAHEMPFCYQHTGYIR